MYPLPSQSTKLKLKPEYRLVETISETNVYHLSETEEEHFVPKVAYDPLVTLDKETPRVSCGLDILSCLYLKKTNLLEYCFNRAKAIKSRWFVQGMRLSMISTKQYVLPCLSKVDTFNKEAWLVDLRSTGMVFTPTQRALVSFLACPEPNRIKLVFYNPSPATMWLFDSAEVTYLYRGQTVVELEISDDQEHWLKVINIHDSN